jgi:hypothetical protein
MLHDRTCKTCGNYNPKARICNKYNFQCGPWNECGAHVEKGAK